MRRTDHLWAQIVAVAAMVLAASAAQAVTSYSWKTSKMVANTPATAYDWYDENNWDPTGEVARLAPGVYTLVSAERLTFGGAWTCASPIPTRTATLRRSGDDLVLKVCTCGTVIISR